MFEYAYTPRGGFDLFENGLSAPWSPVVPGVGLTRRPEGLRAGGGDDGADSSECEDSKQLARFFMHALCFG